MKKIFVIILLVVILINNYKNGNTECELNIIEEIKNILFDDLKKLIKTEKFKIIQGYQKGLTDAFLWKFLNDLDIEKLKTEVNNMPTLKHIIREKFCEYIIKNKNMEFIFFTYSFNMCVITDIWRMMRSHHPLNFGTALNTFGFVGNFFYFLDSYFVFYQIIYKYFLVYFIMLFYFCISPSYIDIFSLCYNHVDLVSNLAENHHYAYNIFKTIDYTKTQGIIDKNLLYHIKTFFILR